MQTDLEGAAVVITGASGGIGGALVQAFAEEGCALGLFAQTRLKALQQWSEERLEVGARIVYADPDLTDPTQVQGGFDRVVAAFGRVDVCIVNAGVWPPEPVPLHEMDPDRVRRVVEVDLIGALWTARAFLRCLARSGPREDGRGAALIFIGSTAGRFGEPGHVEYAASKAALHGVVRTLKSEIVALDPWGRVNGIDPGWTATPMADATLDRPGVLQRVLATVPLRQVARPSDVASLAVALSSPRIARHVSGEIVTVSGGMDGRVLFGPDDIDPARVRARLAPDDGA